MAELYDLSKLTPDKTRLEKRKKLLKRTLVPSAVVLLIGLFLVAPNVITGGAIKSYYGANYDAALRSLKLLSFPNMIESYKYHLNAGDVYYGKKDYKNAEERFRAARDLTPKQYYCQITINLALTIEAQADELVSAKQYDQAIVRYDEIKAIVTESDCGLSVSEKEAGATMEKVGERSNEKSDQAKKARNGDQGDKTDEQADSKQSEPTQSQEQQLKDAADKAAKSRATRQQQRQSNYDTSEHKYDAKNW